MIANKIKILSSKQKFDTFFGDFGNYKSINYVIPLSKPPLITKTDSGLAHAPEMSGEAYRYAPISSTNYEGSANSVNSDVFPTML